MTLSRNLFALSGLIAAALVAYLALRPPPPAPDWPAVGRITVGGPDGQANCTGTLITADLVLTAAHCVVGFAGADPARMATLGFAAGLSDGRHVAFRTARAVLTDPDFAPGPLSTATVPHDVAVLHLSTPILTVPPIPISPLMPFDSQTGFVAYLNATPSSPVTQVNCPTAPRAPGLLFVACPVASGHSGAALLADQDTAPRAVGVVSAKIPIGAYAAQIPQWLLNLIENR